MTRLSTKKEIAEKYDRINQRRADQANQAKQPPVAVPTTIQRKREADVSVKPKTKTARPQKKTAQTIE